MSAKYTKSLSPQDEGYAAQVSAAGGRKPRKSVGIDDNSAAEKRRKDIIGDNEKSAARKSTSRGAVSSAEMPKTRSDTTSDKPAKRGRKPRQAPDAPEPAGTASFATQPPEPAKRGRKPRQAPDAPEPAGTASFVTQPPAPAKRGRKPRQAPDAPEPAGTASFATQPPEPLKRGRKPKQAAEVPQPAKRGRKTAQEAPTALPEAKKRGRKPAQPAPEAPAKRGRKPRSEGETAETPSACTPRVMQLVNGGDGGVNPVVLAGKSVIPRSLRGVEPLSRVMRRRSYDSDRDEEFDESSEDADIVNVTQLVIEDNAPKILRRFNACVCGKCVTTLSKVVAEKIPPRFLTFRKGSDYRSTKRFSAAAESIKKTVVSQMIREMMANKQRSFHS